MASRTRRLRYQVAASLDGFIAGPKGEADWIPMDPDIDFGALFAQYDTLVMGRRTWEGLASTGQTGSTGAFGMKTVVCSRTLRQDDHPGIQIIGENLEAEVRAIKAAEGKDLWLFGGGDLLRSLLALKLVETIEPAVVPILLGGGIPMLPPPAARVPLRLTQHHVYPKSGIALMQYDVISQ